MVVFVSGAACANACPQVANIPAARNPAAAHHELFCKLKSQPLWNSRTVIGWMAALNSGRPRRIREIKDRISRESPT